MNRPHGRSPEEVLEQLDVSSEPGLDPDEVTRRRARSGANRLPDQGSTSPLWLFVKQFNDLLILILVAAAAVSFYSGQMANGYIIVVVIVFNATMGFVQEFRAARAVQAIKDMVKQRATVVRGGEEQVIEATEVVVGDILLLEQGQSVAADGRLLDLKNLGTDEASLTGESEPVKKSTDALDEDTLLADRTNMVWKGTHVVRGSGRAVVTAVGEDTEIGRIAQSLQSVGNKQSNFRKKTGRLARKMATIAVCTSAVVFGLGYFYRSFDFEQIALVTIATMVSSIPEGLPVVISIVLAIGAARMARQNAIIREFTATEILGSVSTILTDKTGTITQSLLTAERAWYPRAPEVTVTGQGHDVDGELRSEGEPLAADARPTLAKVLAIARWCNKATLDRGDGNGEVQARGDPTEVALRILGEKAKVDASSAYANTEVIDDLPFNASQKFRATLVDTGEEGRELLVVGAPERLIALSTQVLTDDGPEDLGDDVRAEIEKKNEEWAGEALRVLVVAHKEVSGDLEAVSAEDVDQLTWTGFVGMIDPPRPGVETAIAECHQAGIRVVMVTGDHQKTAAAIARNVGILDDEDPDGRPEALSEADLADLDDEEFDDVVRRCSVFARVRPETKLRIADRLQASGELIAMTGDGVNDAPALEKADVGIAMGQRGTDVAKDAAQIVLSDDDFSTIVKAIREGRIVFKNVKTTAYFLLTTNFASTATLMSALAMGYAVPLLAVQILWVNMVTDGVMDVAKATEPGHGDIMGRAPIRKDEPILKWEVLPYLLIMAAVMVSLALAAFVYYLPQGIEAGRTGAFFVIALTQIFNVFNMRDLERSVFEIGVFSNKWINRAFVTSLALQLAVVKVPLLRRWFGLADIAYADIAVLFILSSSVLWVGELYKYAQRRFKGAARY